MRYRRTAYLFVAMLACAVVTATRANAQVGGGGGSPYVRGMVTMIMITGDETLPADPNVFARVFEHTGDVRQPAVAAGYNCSFEPIGSTTESQPIGSKTTSLPPATQRPGSIIGFLVLAPRGRETTGDPKQITTAVVERLERFLAKLNQPRLDVIRERAELREVQVRICEREIDGARAEQEGIGRILESRNGGGSPEGLDQLCRELRSQSVMLNVELAGLKARREAVLKRLAEGEKQLAERREAPDVELRYVTAQLKVCENEYQRCLDANRRVPGTMPQKEVEHAKLAVEQAQCRVESHLQAARRQSRDELITGLNQQLANIDIDMATMEAKHQVIKKELDLLNPGELRKLIEQTESIRGRLQERLAARAVAERELDELCGRVRAFRMPTVMVLDDLNVDPKTKKK